MTGKEALRALGEWGLRRVCMTGGPRLFYSLLADRTVDRLYLTTACRPLGGDKDMDTPLKRGPVFPLPVLARLRRLAPDAGGHRNNCLQAMISIRIDRRNGSS